MAELTDGTIVWVKLSNCWWPGEVMGDERLSEDFLSSLRKKPLAVVKFFDEDAYEYVKNPNFIFKYNCLRKNEFLRKGMEQYRAKNKHMEKFPADVMHAERMTGGDPNIVNSTDFLSPKKERYSGLFQDSNKTPKGKLPKTPSSSAGQIPTVVGRKTIHEVRFLTQPSSSNGTARPSDVSNRMESASPLAPTVSPAATSAAIAGSQLYHCHKCGFSSSRQNVIVIHMKNCRAVGGGASTNFTPPRRPLQSTESMLEASRRSVSLSSETPKPSATPVATDTERVEKQKELLHEKSLEEETVPATSRIRASRTQKVAATVSAKKVTADRRRGRRGTQGKKLLNTDSDEEKDDVPKESSNEPDQVENQANTGDRNREPSMVEQVKAVKGKTDAKLKSELLADWSEDEQDDDTDETEKSSEKKAPKKEPIATTPPEAQEGETRSDSEPNQKHQSPSDEESGTAKTSDKETVSVEMSPSNASHTGSASSSATTALPLASPSGTTIKYRNIPKKQKREYIEVTNDDPSVQEKTKTVSRETSGASLSINVGSTEALIGNGVGTSASVAERPISAKQLILNRATRGSSKSLSGDETALAAVTAAAKATATGKLALGDGKLSINHDKVDAKGHYKKDNQQKSKDTVEHGKDENSCFDFKDDDEGEHNVEATQSQPSVSATKTENKETSVTTMQRKSGARNERGTLANDDASQSHVAEEQQQKQDSISEEADRDAKLSKEIDFLLDETDVPKLPDDLDRAVSEKVDCNRVLPPKERGKRIFKTRLSNATVTGSDVKEEELLQSESSLPMQEQLHEEESIKPNNEPQAVSDASKKMTNKLSAAERKWESSDTNNAIETKRKKLAHDELEGEHFQNPSITSSKQVPEREIEATAKVKKAAKDTPSSVPTIEQQQQHQFAGLPAKGRRGKQKKPTPITIPITPINEGNDADSNKTDAKEANVTENDPQPISTPREDEETASTMTLRKSNENRLPDSSSTGEHPRRRSKQRHHPHDEVVTPPVDALEPTRRSSKRSRKDAAPTDDSKPVLDKHDITEPPSETVKVGKVSDEKAEDLAAVDGTVPTETEKMTPIVDSQLKEEETSERQNIQSVAGDSETANKMVEKSSKDTGRLLKRKKNDTAQTSSSEHDNANDKEKPVQNDAPVEATSPALQEKKIKTHHPSSAANNDENAPVSIVDSSTPAMVMASKRTPTDLQIAEALIHLPEAAVVSPKKHDPNDGTVPDNPKTISGKDDDGEATASSAETASSVSNCLSSSPSMVVKGAAQSSSASSSSSKSINPRKRHLQTMLLVSTADASGKEEHIPSSGETTSSSVTNITARYVTTEQQQKPPSSSSIPEKKKRESAETGIATTMKEDAGTEEKFDISSMPIVMSDSGEGLLVNEAVPKEMNVNGGSGATNVKQQEPVGGTSGRKSSPTVASAKGGGSKVQEQIVITSKGTVLTTTSPVVAMTSKMSSATKASSVTVTSAITLGTPGSRMSSSISATTSSSSSSSSSTSSSYIVPRRVQQEQPESSSGGSGSASSAASNTNASTAMVIATPSSSSSPSSAAPKKVITKKLLSDTGSTTLSTGSSSSNSSSGSDNTNSTVASTVVVVDRRYSGDSVTSSSSVGVVKSQQQQQQQQGVSNSSNSRISSEHSGAKKRHRVIQLTPEKLEKFNRLGYIADKGNGKVLTVEGMRKIKQQKQLSQQQKQKLHQSSSVAAKTTVAAVMATTSSTQPVRQAGEDVSEGKRKVKHTLPATHTSLASRSSNSNAGTTKAAVASSSNSSDGTNTSSSNNTTSSRPSSEVATSGNVVVAAAADSSVQELQSAGTSGGAEPSSQQVVVTDADRNAVIVIESKADAENADPEPIDTPDQIVEGTETLQSFPPDTDSMMMEGGGSPTSSTTGGVVGSEMILSVQPELMASPAALVEASSSSSNTGGVAAATAAAAAAAAATATVAATGAEQETHEYMAVPAESFGGPPSLFYLCSMREERLVPVDNQLLYLDASNQLVALTAGHQHDSTGTVVTGGHTAEDIINQAEVIIPAGATNAALASAGIVEVAGTAVEVAEEEDEEGAMSGEGGGGGGVVVETGPADGGAQQSFLINTQDGQQILLDQQSLMALAASGETSHLVTADGQQILLQDTAQEWLAAIAAGQQQQTTLPPDSASSGGGTLSALVTAEGTQIILTQDHAGSLIELQEQASLLPADVLPVNHPSTTIETNAILTKPPIMSTVEVPSKNGRDPNGNSSTSFKQQSEAASPSSATVTSVPGKEDGAAGASMKLVTTPKPPTSSMASTTAMTTNLDETLAAVIGVPSKPNVPTSLELPITVTNPAIAKTTTTSSRINPVLFPIGPSIAGQPTVEGTGTAIVLLASGQLGATDSFIL
ncbi:serine-rich adhesin for platelets-like isoform X2 [Anopheles aquasalis]|uniref:serine-rich adhesin for platelets-like isoform X2 n=1 Tax=Anopheles aquasalis TaxID=42839 RepID=UPI00215B5346|nr:serine-rich adhesin for platelets-like isoform X2 [Anopheles aquasalis]